MLRLKESFNAHWVPVSITCRILALLALRCCCWFRWRTERQIRWSFTRLEGKSINDVVVDKVFGILQSEQMVLDA